MITLAVLLCVNGVIVPDAWIDRTMYMESRGNLAAVGDCGRSRGPYQIQRRAWEAFGGPTPWRVWAHHPQASRAVCRRIMAACVRRCVRDHRPVTFATVRFYYRRGGY
jgi:hypothetical protein